MYCCDSRPSIPRTHSDVLLAYLAYFCILSTTRELTLNLHPIDLPSISRFHSHHYQSPHLRPRVSERHAHSTIVGFLGFPPEQFTAATRELPDGLGVADIAAWVFALRLTTSPGDPEIPKPDLISGEELHEE